jgi:hypothetical protein
VFVINGGAVVSISGVTISNGSSLLGGGIFNAGALTLTDCIVSNNQVGTQLGGGIFNSGALTLTTSVVADNVITNPSGGGGAGIYNFHGVITLNNSRVSNNAALGDGSYNGGGILNDQGLATLNNSMVSNNGVSAHTDGDATGGGIANINSGSLILNGTTVSGNHVSGSSDNTGGGGISTAFPIGHGSLRLTNSTVSGNSVSGAGGGAGIRNLGGATILNSTIVNNSGTVGASGGGILNRFTLKISNSTIAGNSVGLGLGGGIDNIDAGALTIKNTIISANTGGNCSLSSTSVLTSGGFNLSSDGACETFLTQTGDLNNTPAGLDPAGLLNHGGPTLTIALGPASAALNAIPANSCTDVNGAPVTTDQRGVARPQGANCDIGAFEFFPTLFELDAVQTFILIEAVTTLSLPEGSQQSLTAPLHAAVDSINLGEINPAIHQLGAFVNSAIGHVRGGKLTSAQAAPLTTSAQQIIAHLATLD